MSCYQTVYKRNGSQLQFKKGAHQLFILQRIQPKSLRRFFLFFGLKRLKVLNRVQNVLCT